MIAQPNSQTDSINTPNGVGDGAQTPCDHSLPTDGWYAVNDVYGEYFRVRWLTHFACICYADATLPPIIDKPPRGWHATNCVCQVCVDLIAIAAKYDPNIRGNYICGYQRGALADKRES
jgi:hypothetical protein